MAGFLNNGANDGARTRDNWYHKPVLYQLSYIRHNCIVTTPLSPKLNNLSNCLILVELIGLEPTTPCMPCKYSTN